MSIDKMKAKIVEYKGVKIRPETYDKQIVDEQKVYRDLDFLNATVLDIGANIGAFARFALANGAKKVVCYEPEESNFSLLKLNVEGKNVDCRKKAIVGETATGKMEFYLNRGINKGAHSLYIKRGRDIVSVETTSIRKVLKEVKPEIVKIDTEGAEYDILDNFNFDEVSQLAVEFHLNKKEWREKCGDYVQSILAAGFEVVKPPKDTGQNWTTIGVFKKKR
jgi:FkbM family methyltransferase